MSLSLYSLLYVAETRTCSDKEFTCSNGRCIPSHWQCDNEKDCTDESDEDPKTCLYDIKEAKKVLLSTTSRFVSWVCCVCAEKRSCELNMFECAPGVCISPAWVCDRQPDCVDARDEFNCRQKVCSPEEFTCRSQLGECVPLTWMCDDNADCSDGSDEKACSKLGLPYSHVACPARLLAH
uniref:Uncharacterized protein n=1 Tax=Timema douglasi TaxID=61478 RepID=A0A7R8Z4E8_TIMDO|nr:unnamed protein product [Timema douglasi]